MRKRLMEGCERRWRDGCEWVWMRAGGIHEEETDGGV